MNTPLQTGSNRMRGKERPDLIPNQRKRLQHMHHPVQLGVAKKTQTH